MFNVLKDLKLSKDVSDLVSLYALLLVHVLHGVHLLRVPLLHDAYLQQQGGGGGYMTTAECFQVRLSLS